MSKYYKGKTSKLIDLCESITDCHHSTPQWTDEGKIVIRNFNIKNGKLLLDEISYTDEATYQERISRSQPYPGDLIITREAPMGEVCIIPDGIECCLGQRLVLIKPNLNKINNKYLLYALLSEYTQNQIKQSNNTGSTVSNLRIPLLKNLDIPLNNNQDKIASVLSSIDDKIEINNRINSELENLAKTIYDYWFVQFDFPDENGKPYKSSGGKMVYNQELKREIPAGWEVKPLVEWICNDKGGDWGKDIKQGNFNTKVVCIRGTDLNGLNGNGEFNAPIRYILEKNSPKFLEPCDLIVEISGGSPIQSTGRLGYISPETLRRFNTPVICSNFCKAISLNNVKSLYYFVYLWNSIYANNVFFNWEGKTTGIKNLLFDSFVNSYTTVFPPISLIEKFFNIRQTIQSQQQINILQNQELTELRDWLLPMLMNGQITIK